MTASGGRSKVVDSRWHVADEGGRNIRVKGFRLCWRLGPKPRRSAGVPPAVAWASCPRAVVARMAVAQALAGAGRSRARSCERIACGSAGVKFPEAFEGAELSTGNGYDEFIR